MRLSFSTALLLLVASLFYSCIDPVVPEYDFQTGFYLIEGRIADVVGQSEVRVTESAIEFDNYTLAEVEGVSVSTIDGDGNEQPWRGIGDSRFVPADSNFVAQAGQSYYMRVASPDGDVFESSPETLPTPTTVQNLRYVFEQESYFSEALNRFVPAFRVLVDVDDPAGEDNFYQYDFRVFKFLSLCAFCERSVFRDGKCVESRESRFVPRYDYSCDAACWSITRGAQLNIMSDRTNPGGTISGVQAGRIDFDGIDGQLIEVTQLSLTERFYDYNRVIRDLTEGAGGLNAPIPAPLYGNFAARGETAVDALGYVGVVSVNTARFFLDRSEIDGTPLPFITIPRFEPLIPSPPTAPCEESPDRTRIKPEGWPF